MNTRNEVDGIYRGNKKRGKYENHSQKNGDCCLFFFLESSIICAAVKRFSADSRRRAIRLAKRDDIDDRRFVKKI